VLSFAALFGGAVCDAWLSATGEPECTGEIAIDESPYYQLSTVPAKALAGARRNLKPLIDCDKSKSLLVGRAN
jgi:hypothetical protein